MLDLSGIVKNTWRKKLLEGINTPGSQSDGRRENIRIKRIIGTEIYCT